MSRNILWIDLEMTGLDEKIDHILEAAAIVTDGDLKPLEEMQRVVFQPPSIVEGMNDWCKKTHGESGLTALIPTGTPLEQVEAELLVICDRHFKAASQANPKKDDLIILAGNSIANDRRFIDKYWPKLAARLHYRMIDVTAFKEVYKSKYGLEFKKKNSHRAIDDIFESIHELEYYLSFVKVPPA